MDNSNVCHCEAERQRGRSNFLELAGDCFSLAGARLRNDRKKYRARFCNDKPWKLITLLILTCALSISPLTSFAALKLELTQGITSAVPIAVLPFAGQPSTQSASAKSSNNVAAIITADLSNSGQFKVLPVNNIQQVPHALNQVNFNLWRQQKVDDIVIGSAKNLGDGRYQVKFSLINTYNKSTQQQSPVLASQSYTVPAKQLRHLAHHISDIIYQQLTGAKGVFSTKIAYILVQRHKNKAKYSLEIADYDGFNPQPILVSTQPIMSPAWSPDGKKIAYVSFEHKRAAIYISNIASGRRKLLTSFVGINGAPAWSPDGSQIALVLSKTGHPKIYMYDLHHHRIKQVTFGWSIDTEPSFAPDGRSLIFTSNRGGSPQIYRLDLRDHKVTRLTFDGNYNTTASFMPNGKAIALLHRAKGKYDVAIKNLQTGALIQLTQDGYDSSPSIAPNGKLILYASTRYNRGELGIVSTDGKVKIRLPAPNGSVQEAAWSPFLG